ncbi:hypothetical protein BCR36DRAFT_396937 [Piromyces finnis]|uniref:Right handed beta helix domain-containing protein n=1 Tax=Piromyces finnis TaxID=1754191 RepID=A0A1Y1VBK3_9FUNG|nr:hypothetical protein BCR36DRAFT_396937 [Piromyces finnis]|eukprot:ORX52137.1 hypothetical protein BCR36DRAFT_396937 [Piromyces finnis]
MAHITSDNTSLVNFKNITQINTGGIKGMNDGGLIMNNLSINKLIGNGEYGLFYTSHDSLDISFLASNITLNNLFQLNLKENAIFYIENKNKIKNVHVCNLNNKCENFPNEYGLMNKAEIILSTEYNDISISNTIFDNINGDKGVIAVYTYIDFRNNTVKNSYFKNGFFYMDENDQTSGLFMIYDSLFVNNTGEAGTIFHIGELLYLTGCTIESTSSQYIGNNSTKYGGVIYSMGQYNNLHTKFIDNVFIDNHSRFGDVIYSYSKESNPNISNINELEAIDGAIVTKPAKIILSEDSIKSFSIHSGDFIPKNIKSN